MELLSMTDFVLEQTELFYDKNQSKLIHNIVNYAQFIKQPLHRGMFVPCDENGNILEEPVWQVEFEKNKVSDSNLIKKSKQYEQAKEKVLFENIKHLSYNPVDKSNELYDYKNNHLFFIEENETIEYLVEYNLQLTTNAIKQFM